MRLNVKPFPMKMSIEFLVKQTRWKKRCYREEFQAFAYTLSRNNNQNIRSELAESSKIHLNVSMWITNSADSYHST